MKKNSEVIVKTLRNAGVEVVFGIPSVHNIGFYEALRQEPSIRHILCRHEASATHMADGYARSTNKIGVVVVSTGPGVTYTISPLMEAWWCCSPVLIITSNVRSDQIGRGLGVLHELYNQSDLFKDITKAVICLRAGDDIQTAVERAVSIAISDRPGPVYLEIPTDFWDLEFSSIKDEAEREPETRTSSDIDAAVQLLQNAKNPLIVSGVEALHAGVGPAIRSLVETLHAPFVTDFNGKGIIPEDHPLAFGSATRRGVVREIHRTCDVTLAIGSRLRYVDFKRRGVTLPGLIHIDWDTTWISKNYPADMQLIGDVQDIVVSLTKGLDGISRSEEHRGNIQELREKLERDTLAATKGRMEAEYIRAVRQAIPPESSLVVDNTIVGYFAEQLYMSLKPGGIIAPKGATPIGFAFPAAVGVKIANPKMPVVALTGDGGFLYGTQEMATCAQYGIGFPVIVVNDSSFRMIDYLQLASYGKGYETTLVNPDFVTLAESYGFSAVRVDSPEKLGEALEKALTTGDMWLIELVASFPDPPFGQV